MSVAFSFLDIAVVAVILVSTVYATYRGLVAESLAIFGWIAAAYAMLFFGPWCATWMEGIIAPHWLGELIGYGIVFLIVLLPLTFASSRISENIKKSQVGTLDSVLGSAFGILRGVAIVGIAYLLFTAWVPTREQPDWVSRARLLPVIRASAEVVASLIPDQDVRADRRRADDRPVENAHDRAADKQALERKIAESQKAPPPKAKPAAKPAKHAKKTYGAKDRQALDRLIEATDSDTSGKP
jgi:membrane protein required for colicin V production